MLAEILDTPNCCPLMLPTTLATARLGARPSSEHSEPPPPHIHCCHCHSSVSMAIGEGRWTCMRSTNRSRVRLPTAGLSGTSFDRLFTRTCVSATRQYSTWYRRKLSIGKKVEHGSEGKGEDSEKRRTWTWRIKRIEEEKE